MNVVLFLGTLEYAMKFLSCFASSTISLQCDMVGSRSSDLIRKKEHKRFEIILFLNGNRQFLFY